MKILIGTTNPSKVKRFERILSGNDVEFYTLQDLKITSEPEESGRTVEENAIIKAKYYGQFYDRVICDDSGLYFEDLPIEDDRQPGLNIRTPGGCDRLDDEEMIAYYTRLIGTLGGRVLAFYLDGMAVYNQGKIFSYMESRETMGEDAFYMVDVASDKRHPGWPLDSISIDKDTLTYFVDEDEEKEKMSKENAEAEQYQERLTDFLEKALGLKK